MARMHWLRLGGAAAIAGGAMWAAKAGLILVGRGQPPYLFSAASLAFLLALLAFGALLEGQRDWATRTGQIVAVTSIVVGAANVLEEALTDWEPAPAVSSAVDLIAGLGPFVGLALLGWASRDVRTFRPRVRPGALTLAALYPLAAVLLFQTALLVDLDGPIGERLIELPILTIGLGWVFFGVALVRLSIVSSTDGERCSGSRLAS